MARALIGQGVLTPVHGADLRPNGSFFPVPKNQEKGSFIVSLMAFNKNMRSRPLLLQFPSIELATILMPLPDTGNLHSLPRCSDCDWYMVVWWEMFPLRASGQGEQLLACHVDINSCFLTLVLPLKYHDSFCICVDDTVYAFKVLLFGWAYSLVICQEVLTDIFRRVSVRDVIVLICYDNIQVLGLGAASVQTAANTIVEL